MPRPAAGSVKVRSEDRRVEPQDELERFQSVSKAKEFGVRETTNGRKQRKRKEEKRPCAVVKQEKTISSPDSQDIQKGGR
jgi:hypothetical protein